MILVNVVCAPTLLLGIDVMDVLPERDVVPGRVPPSVTAIDPDKGVGEAVEVDNKEQLGTPSGHDIIVIILVVKITVVDRSGIDVDGKGTTVGGWDA
jgi:hypothetical protein